MIKLDGNRAELYVLYSGRKFEPGALVDGFSRGLGFAGALRPSRAGTLLSLHWGVGKCKDGTEFPRHKPGQGLTRRQKVLAIEHGNTVGPHHTAPSGPPHPQNMHHCCQPAPNTPHTKPPMYLSPNYQ
jgi:hypothetical protein